MNMTRERAINMIRGAIQQGTPMQDIKKAVLVLKLNHGVDVSDLFDMADKVQVIKQKRKDELNNNPCRFDINTYGAGNARSFNQSKSLLGK